MNSFGKGNMKERFGQLTAELAESASEQVTAELVRLINQNIKPLKPVGPDDVCIRSMYVISDQVNSYGGRFPAIEHERLSSLLVDSPVMVGHRKDALPIGRNFHAATVDRNGRPWVRSYFYWPKSAEGAESLRENIDKGVYKECSIGFTYLTPECSVCGEDIRKCSHNLFQEYEVGGESHVCHFNYRQIERVLETSLVYRGATPDTAIADELKSAETAPPESERDCGAGLPVLSELTSLNPEATYLVVPHYEGLDVSVEREENGVCFRTLSGQELPSSPFTKISLPPEFGRRRGKLVGYRGKERCSVEQVRQYLAFGKRPVTRVMLYLYPDEEISAPHALPRVSSARVFHHRFATSSTLAQCAEELKTKSGVEIWQLSSDKQLAAGIRYVPSAPSAATPFNFYSLSYRDGSPNGYLSIKRGTRETRLVVHALNLARLKRGALFIADPNESEMPVALRTIISGASVATTISGGFRLGLGNQSKEVLCIQPIRLDERARFLTYLSSGVQ